MSVCSEDKRVRNVGPSVVHPPEGSLRMLDLHGLVWRCCYLFQGKSVIVDGAEDGERCLLVIVEYKLVQLLKDDVDKRISINVAFSSL